MIFKENSPLYATEIERRPGEDILYVNYMGASFVPSIAENPEVMASTIGILAENPTVSRIVFVQQRNYNYPFEQVALLTELAALHNFLIKQEGVLLAERLSIYGNAPRFYSEVSHVMELMKQDPIACYAYLKRRANEIRDGKATGDFSGPNALQNYLRFLDRILILMEQTKLIRQVIGESRGGREIYSSIFRPDILPNFTFTRLVSQMPKDAEFVDQYEVSAGEEDVQVTILKIKGDSKYFYHVLPPEYTLNEEHHYLVNLARNVLTEHRPKAEEFTDPARTRQVFFNVARDLVSELSKSKGINLNYRELVKLAKIIVRHTIGFGLIEILLLDEKLQDISLNAPIAMNRIFVRHEKYDECSTNIIPSYEDAESWAAKLRLQSGRPLDEANPILDTDLVFENSRARVAAIKEPLSPSGLAYAFRRHRDNPWTLPLFIKNKMINSFAAGLLSFLIDGNRTLLVAGTRSSGKCVDGNTLIQLSDGRIEKIKDLAGNEKTKIEDGAIFTPISDLKVKSMGEMKITNKTITDVWKRKSPAKVVRLRTKSGKQIITTMEHPYPTFDFARMNTCFERADNLRVGELIATPRFIVFEGEEISFDLRNKPYFISEEENYFVLKGKTNSSTVKFPKKLTPDLAELIGLIIGDGHLDSKKLEFHNSCEELRERYISLIKAFCVPYRVFDSRTTKVVQISSSVLSNVLNEIFEIPFGNKSDKVIIPSPILKSGNDILARFLRGYFDTDGYIPYGKRDLELASASKYMAEYLRLALLRFGVVSFVKEKKVKGVSYYRILIRGKFADEFCKKIGFSHPMKKQRAEKLILTNYIANTNTDIIPYGNELVSKLRAMFRVSPNEHRQSGKDYWAYENHKYRVSREGFGRILDFYEKRYSYLVSLNGQVDVLRDLAKFDSKDYFGKLEIVRRKLGISYGSFAVKSGLSDRGVRKILNAQHAGRVDSFNKVLGALEILEEKSSNQDNIEVETAINELLCKRIMLNSVKIGVVLSNLREALNISNEEFASAGISLTTITNVFNGVYVPGFDILKILAKKIIEIYSATVSKENKEILEMMDRLSKSDIFWDEISSVEVVDRIDDYVYDLSVEDTHNFVANGMIAHNTSLLGSLMLEIIPKYRVIVVEDTLELAVDSMRKLGYDILRMKVRSALVSGTTEVEASEGIRASLRLGDSALIVGEVRSAEAKALYEAMRVGALANVVAGTIHGDSPYGVFDRVVNDLNVERTSFKATDLIIVANPIKTPDGMHSMRRVVQVTEVRKHWNKDPLDEKGFVDLLRYNVETDELEPTQELINGDSEIIKNIAGSVKGWAGNWDAVYDNILLRGKIKQEIVDISAKLNKPELMEAKFNSLCNSAFHSISDKVRQEFGLPLGDKVLAEFRQWLYENAEKF